MIVKLSVVPDLLEVSTQMKESAGTDASSKADVTLVPVVELVAVTASIVVPLVRLVPCFTVAIMLGEESPDPK